MSFYPNPDAVLAEARMRLDKLGSSCGVLIVEGWSDRTLLEDRFIPREQLIAAGSKNLVLGAHSRAGTHSDGILFLVDCDYDVAAGELRGTQTLLITENADIEADLVGLGLMEHAVRQVLPSTLEDSGRVCSDVVDTAVKIAEAIGILRRYARTRGSVIGFKGLPYRRAVEVFSNTNSQSEVRRVIVGTCANRPLDPAEIEEAVSSEPEGLTVCNGHDLVELVRTVLEVKYSIRKSRLGNMPALLRTSLNEHAFERWMLSRRLKSWQTITGRHVLRDN